MLELGVIFRVRVKFINLFDDEIERQAGAQSISSGIMQTSNAICAQSGLVSPSRDSRRAEL